MTKLQVADTMLSCCSYPCFCYSAVDVVVVVVVGAVAVVLLLLLFCCDLAFEITLKKKRVKKIVYSYCKL